MHQLLLQHIQATPQLLILLLLLPDIHRKLPIQVLQAIPQLLLATLLLLILQLQAILQLRLQVIQEHQVRQAIQLLPGILLMVQVEQEVLQELIRQVDTTNHPLIEQL